MSPTEQRTERATRLAREQATPFLPWPGLLLFLVALAGCWSEPGVMWVVLARTRSEAASGG